MKSVFLNSIKSLPLIFILTVDAVYAMAHALHNIVEHYCGHMPYVLCDIKEHIPGGAELLKYIHNVSFIGQQGTKVNYV